VRVLILSQLFHPEPDIRGLPLARELQERGHEVEVLTGFPNYPGGEVYPGYALRPWKREVVDSVAVRRLMMYPSHDRSGARRALSYLSFGFTAALLGPVLIRKPDVVYVYNLITLMPAARWIRRLTGAKVVLDIQDLWPQSVAASGLLGSKRALFLLKKWSDASYAAADRIVVLSPGFKRDLVNRGILPGRVEVIYNWAPDPSYAGSELEKPVRPDRRFDVLFAGTIGIMQGLDVVVESARQLQDRAPDVRFTLVGSGVDQQRLRDLASELSNVRFLPRRPASEMGELLASADALLVHLKDDPLFRVTIPSKVQAYLQAGKPVLCGIHGDAAELVQRSGAGRVFSPDDANALSAAVLELRGMTPDGLDEMGRRGKTFYERELAIGLGVTRLEDVFRALGDNPIDPAMS
jgi:colanic acid biosynthesis glycosyl transferase WcaI